MKKILIIIGVVLGLAIVFYFFGATNKTIAPDSLQVVKTPETTATPSANASLSDTLPKIVTEPLVVIQGDPVMIRVENLSASTSVQKILFAGKSISFFIYNTKPTAFVPIDLGGRVGEYDISAELSDGTVLKNTVTVLTRTKSTAPLGIPAKLGGNSTTSQKNLVNNLTIENAAIKALTTSVKSLWGQGFQYPISNPVVTDSYGYSRLTGAYTISHLGTDFHAAEGTSVFAMNRGAVEFARSTVIYGNMIVIDHGLGLQTLYAHLSKINISEGQSVERGQIIGKSGQTGYAEQPHLHISVKINKISVDPIIFLKFFQ